MIPTIAVPVPTQMPPPVQTAAVSGVPTETSLTARIPFYAVPSTVSAVEVYNNGRGARGGAFANSAKPQASSHTDTPFDLTSSQLQEAPIKVSPFTTTFMTQVLGQKPNGVTNEALVSMFFGSSVNEAPAKPTLPATRSASPAGRPSPQDPTTIFRLSSSMVRKVGVEGYMASHARSNAVLLPQPEPTYMIV